MTLEQALALLGMLTDTVTELQRQINVLTSEQSVPVENISQENS